MWHEVEIQKLLLIGEVSPCTLLSFSELDRRWRIINELLAQLALRKKAFSQNPVTPQQLGALIDMVNEKTITGEITP